MAFLAPIAGAAIGGALFPGAIGFLGLTGASAGFLVGNIVSSLLSPAQKVSGSRLSDFKVTGSAFGSPVPYIVGRARVGGQVVYGSDLREIPNVTKSGKGGPSVETTNYTYEGDLLIKVASNRGRIRKIMRNGELVWTAASDADYGSINASGDFCRSVRIYDGAPDQQPDPVYEAAMGVGNTPAFRGCTTVMLEGTQYGNSKQIPVFTFEFVEVATDVVNTAQLHAESQALSYGHFAHTTADGTRWARWSGTGKDFDAFYQPVGGAKLYDRTVTMTGAEYATSGNADRLAIVVVSGFFTTRTLVNFVDGTRTKELIAADVGDSLCRYAISGTTMVVSTTNKLSRFDLGASANASPVVDASNEAYAPVAQAALPAGFSRHVIADTDLFSLTANLGVKTVYRFDLETLSVLGTFMTPSVSATAELLLDEIGDLLLLDYNALYRWNGATWDTIRAIPAGYGAVSSSADFSGCASFPAMVNDALTVVRSVNVEGLRIAVSWPAIEAQDFPLNTVCTRLCERAGISSTDLNVTALAGLSVAGMVISPSTTRQPLELLASTFMFEWCGLKAVLRGGAPVATIPWDDLGAVRDGEESGEPLPLKKRNDIEIPAYIHVKYINGDNDYQDGLESSDRLATESNSVEVVEVPIVMSATQAKRLANMLAADLQASMITVGPVTIQRDWEALEPCDVVLFTAEDGSQMRTRIQKRQSADGLITLEGVFDDASVVTSNANTDTSYTSSSTVNRPTQSRALMVDTAPLRDADIYTPGAYVAIDALSLPFSAATLFMGPDDVTYDAHGQVQAEAAIGTVEGSVGDWKFNVMDNVNSFVIDMGDSPMFNATRDDVFDKGANAWAIGQPGRWELGQSCNFTSLGGGRWLVRNHLRGRRGTGHNTGNHAARDYFVLLNPAGLLRPGMDYSELNQTRYLKSVTSGRTLVSAQASSGVNTGESLRPFAPAAAHKIKAANNDQTLSWDPVTRLSGEFPGGTDIPADPAITGWEIDYFTSSAFTTKAGTLSAPTASRLATSAEQTAMGLTPGATLHFRIYPISALIGRGHYLQGSL